MWKRCFDFFIALIGLALMSPLLVVLGILIKLGSPGPIFYRGIRTSMGEGRFHIFKFRTMVVNADQIGGSSTADGDARITSVGRWLRKYKLDELPQLFNVLAGNMSFVGPRPELPFYTDMYTAPEKKILTVRPGITDFATLWNPDEGALLAGESDPDRAYFEKVRPTKIRLQLEYIDKASLLTDLGILFATLGVVGKKALGVRARA